MSKATSVQVQQCPECRQDYDTSEERDRYPTSCRWCAYTICCACVQERPRTNQSKDYGIPCVKCGKGGAFRVKAPVVHQFSCRLLAQIQLLQGQLVHQQRQLQSLSNPNNDSTCLAMHPSRIRTVSDSSEELPPPQTQSPTFLTTILQAEEEDPFPNGTSVYDGHRWGKIDSSTQQKVYAIRYGDGDPEWVGYNEMVDLVQAADAKLNNGSESLVSEDSSMDEDDFVGRDVFREFSRMGWFWGKVVKCRSMRQYKVAFSGNSRKKLEFSQEKVRQWVLAAQRKNDSCFDISTGSKKLPPIRKTLGSSPSKESVQTKKAKTPPRKRKSIDSSPPKNFIQSKKAKMLNSTPKTSKASQASGPKDDISIGDDLKLSASVRGEGWDGFDRHISDSKLPTKFRDILELMDVLFPVAKGEQTFYYSLWACSLNKGWGGGYEVREALKTLKKKDENALSWHEKSTPYVPKTKKDLARFIEVLMGLKMSPRLKDPKPPTKGRGIKTASSINKPKEKANGDLILSDGLTLSASLQGSGWKGFHKAISAKALPGQFGQVFRLMDFFFPVAPGEKSFVESLYDCSDAATMKAGDSIRKTLRRLKLKDPDIPGLQWHKCHTPYVPETRKDLADFMRLLMRIRKATVVATPPRKRYDGNKRSRGKRVLLGK